MLEQVQGIPWVLIHLVRQVSPHDLVMGGIDPGSPLSPDSPCLSGLSAWACHGWDWSRESLESWFTLPVRPLPHDLVMGVISCACSRHRWEMMLRSRLDSDSKKFKCLTLSCGLCSIENRNQDRVIEGSSGWWCYLQINLFLINW